MRNGFKLEARVMVLIPARGDQAKIRLLAGRFGGNAFHCLLGYFDPLATLPSEHWADGFVGSWP